METAVIEIYTRHCTDSMCQEIATNIIDVKQFNDEQIDYLIKELSKVNGIIKATSIITNRRSFVAGLVSLE